MRSPYETLSPCESHIRPSGYLLQLASPPTSTRCPDMAAAPDRRLSYLAPRVLDAHPVYTVSRDVSHDASTRRSPRLHCVGILRARAFIVRGSPRGALHNWAMPGRLFTPRPACLPDRGWTSLSGSRLPNSERIVGGSEGRRLAHTGSNGCSCTRPYRSAD